MYCISYNNAEISVYILHSQCLYFASFLFCKSTPLEHASSSGLSDVYVAKKELLKLFHLCWAVVMCAAVLL